MKAEMLKNVYKSNLKSRAMLVINYLIFRANNEGTCFPAIKTIAKDCHISVNTVKRGLEDLVEAGFVKKDARFVAEKNGAQTSNLYSLVVDVREKDTEDIPRENFVQVAQDETADVVGQESASETAMTAGLRVVLETSDMLIIRNGVLPKMPVVGSFLTANIHWAAPRLNFVPP